jgi:hypothetical protein
MSLLDIGQYGSLAKYGTTWVRIPWDKRLEIAEQSEVMCPQMILPSGSIFSKATVDCSRILVLMKRGLQLLADEWRQANWEANKGKERKDLYTEKWDGAEYKGSPINVLTIILIVSVLTPLIGVIFALRSYGTLWG